MAPRRGRVAARRRRPGASRRAAEAIVRAWGKTPVRCADSPRLHRQPGQPAVHDRGAPAARGGRGVVEAIDAAMRAAGFPMGPFELMDLAGIDVNLAAARGVWEGLGRPGPPPAVADPGAPRRGGPPGPQDRRGVLSVRRGSPRSRRSRVRRRPITGAAPGSDPGTDQIGHRRRGTHRDRRGGSGTRRCRDGAQAGSGASGSLPRHDLKLAQPRQAPASR